MKRMHSPHADSGGRRQRVVVSDDGTAAGRDRTVRLAAGPARARPSPAALATVPGITVVPVVSAVNDADPPAGCAICRHRTAFENCADPVAAGLTKTFSLIGHPQQGHDCPAYAPVNEQDGVAYWRIRMPDRFEDLAVCPPEPIESIRRRFPGALRIEPIAYLDAWPVAAPGR